MPLLRAVLFFTTCLPMAAWSLQQYSVRVVDQKPQARENFVQGLEILDGYLYVSTGNYGQSHLLRYNFADGRLDAARNLDERIFGEGLTVLGDNIYQLTWQNRAMLVYRKSDLLLQLTLPIEGEGWGLTNNGTDLIYSDGSAMLHFMSPDTAQILRTITVTEKGQPVRLLNELEWVGGAIWANIWQSDRIVMINPLSGEVTATIDLRGLLPPREYRRGTDVLNGIARNPADGAIWVTGKRWPWLYRIELVPTLNTSETQQKQSKSR
jgi:glutamine cyclotransferase